ncbi:MAG TPA: hypothetical protein VNS79_09630 [Sphingobium sp.]|nr:hypothetical protein [Sphingobium sp.]
MTDGGGMARAQRASPAAARTTPAAALVARLTGRPPVPLTVETLLDDHLVQRWLCDELEAVADGLPGLPPPDVIRRLCDRILWITGTHFARAEAIFRNLPPGCGPAPAALEALCRMHRLDEVHAQDLVAMLWRQASGRAQAGAGGGASADVGQLAYMLRCFFDGGRRAIALKESWIADGRAPASARA